MHTKIISLIVVLVLFSSCSRIVRPDLNERVVNRKKNICWSEVRTQMPSAVACFIQLQDLVHIVAKKMPEAERKAYLAKHEVEKYWGFASAHSVQKQNDLAEKYFKKALSLSPKNLGLNRDAGLFFANSKKFSEADRVLRVVEKVNPKLTDSARAVYFFKKGQYSKAWKKVASVRKNQKERLDPTFIRALKRAMPEPKSSK